MRKCLRGSRPFLVYFAWMLQKLQAFSSEKTEVASGTETLLHESKKTRSGEEFLTENEVSESTWSPASGVSTSFLAEENQTDDSFIVDAALDMAKDVAGTIDLILKNLEKLEGIEKRVNEIADRLDKIDARVTEEVSCRDSKIKKVEKVTADLENGAESLPKDTRDLKKEIDENEVKLKGEIENLNLHLLNMEVYQRRENLRFYGLEEKPETGGVENTEMVLKDFLEHELDKPGAYGIKFHRVHRVGRQKRQDGKPRPIIARFLNYPDREKAMSLRKNLEGGGYGIGPDLPKEVLEMRKPLIPKLVQTRKEGKTAFSADQNLIN